MTEIMSFLTQITSSVNHIPDSIFCIIKADEDHKAPSNDH